MASRRIRHRLTILALAASLALTGGVLAEDPSVEELKRDLQAMKEQMRQMQETIRKQDEAIAKLSKASHGGAATPAPALAAAQPAPSPAPSEQEREERLKDEVAAQVAREMQPKLASLNKTFPSQFNPAIGLILDNAFSSKTHERANFEFRSAEIGLSASVDPFVRGSAIITGTPDGFEVEEASLVTTSLPYNLTVKGGRFFADFGRLSKFHDHDLPFVNRPLVLQRFIDGESQADGVEVSWLAPLPQYLTLTGGWYNKIGADNERTSNDVARDFSKFTYLGRAATFFNLNDENSVDLGGSYAYTPKIDSEDGGDRNLAGADITFRYTPLSEASYHGLIWGTEFLYNREEQPVGGFPEQPTDTPLVFKYRDAVGLYSYVEARLTRRFAPGFLFDYVQDIAGVQPSTRAYSPYLTIWASEFQRLRLQYTYLDQPHDHENQFFVQWTAILGSHVHGFRDR
jgi:hypothetical protein